MVEGRGTEEGRGEKGRGPKLIAYLRVEAKTTWATRGGAKAGPITAKMTLGKINQRELLPSPLSGHALSFPLTTHFSHLSNWPPPLSVSLRCTLPYEIDT